jgi:hypothetical protein
MADFFVKVGGSDANNGTTWALAKATIQAGLNLCTTAGDRCVAAPGVYFEVGIYPPSAGARGTNKHLYGDWDCRVADGGGLFSGAVPGYIVIDGSVQTGNFGRSGSSAPYSVLRDSNNWAYWDLSNLYVCGGGVSLYIQPSSGNPANDGVTFTNILTDSADRNVFANWTIDPDTYSPITFKRCLFLTRRSSSTNQYNTGISLIGIKSSSYYTNPQFEFERCYLIGISAPFYLGGGSTSYTFARLKNCSCIAITASPSESNSWGFYGLSATYNKVDVYDSYVEARNRDSGVTISETRVQTYFANNIAASTLSQYPLMAMLPFLFRGSPLIGASSGYGLFPDFFGVPVKGAEDTGAQEFVTGVYPKPPTMKFQRTPSGAIYRIGV